MPGGMARSLDLRAAVREWSWAAWLAFSIAGYGLAVTVLSPSRAQVGPIISLLSATAVGGSRPPSDADRLASDGCISFDPVPEEVVV
jgi:hypothetical protein